MTTKPCLDCNKLFTVQHRARQVSRCEPCYLAMTRVKNRVRVQHNRFRSKRSTKEQLAQATHCGKCGEPFRIGQRKTLGHIISLENGGSSDPSNYQPECERCNYGHNRKS